MKKAKAVVKRAATKGRHLARKAGGKFNMNQVLMANAGGMGAAFIVDKADDNEKVAENPFYAPAIAEGAGIALMLFGGEKTRDLASGMMGGAAALMYQPIMDKMNENKDDSSAPANGTNTIDGKRTTFNNVIRQLRQSNAHLLHQGKPHTPAMSAGDGYSGKWRNFSHEDSSLA